MLCKIHNDGSHFIALELVNKLPLKEKSKGLKENLSPMDKAFDELYFLALQEDLPFVKQKEFVRNGISKQFGIDSENLDKWLDQKFEVKLRNIEARKKRFRRKAYLNNWNYFVTFTYDDKKQSEESFKASLRKCLSNLHSRRGWKYMGVWEYGKQEQRLHFHALIYVPAGEMVGKIEEKQEYSKRKHKMITRFENDFFLKFGRNDFQPISKKSLTKGRTLDYILKYITKTNEKIVYSRGIPSDFIDDINDNDIVTEFEDFVIKYVLFDDIYDDENRRVLKSVFYDDLAEFEDGVYSTV